MRDKVEGGLGMLLVGLVLGGICFGILCALSEFPEAMLGLRARWDISTMTTNFVATMLGIAYARKLGRLRKPLGQDPDMMLFDGTMIFGTLVGGGVVASFFADGPMGQILWFFVPLMFIIGIAIYIVVSRKDIISQNFPSTQKPIRS